MSRRMFVMIIRQAISTINRWIFFVWVSIRSEGDTGSPFGRCNWRSAVTGWPTVNGAAGLTDARTVRCPGDGKPELEVKSGIPDPASCRIWDRNRSASDDIRVHGARKSFEVALSLGDDVLGKCAFTLEKDSNTLSSWFPNWPAGLSPLPGAVRSLVNRTPQADLEIAALVEAMVSA